jgi:hypothetical protein
VSRSSLDASNLIRRRRRVAVGISVGFVAFLALGCREARETTTVQGTVSYGGKALEHGIINFQKSGARPWGGGIASDGTYQFDVPPGDYQVRIDAPAKVPDDWKEGDSPPSGARQAPEKYASYATSELTAKVEAQGEPQTIDFELQ